MMKVHLTSLEKLEFDKVREYIKKYAISDLGREQIDLIRPSSKIEEIKFNLSLVSEMKQLIETDDPIPIENIHDVRIPLHRSSIENYVLSSDDLIKIRSLLKVSSQIYRYFSKRSKLYPLLFDIVKNIHLENVLEYNINKAIDDDGKVRDSASKELKDIRKKIIEKCVVLKKSLEVILKSLSGKEWTQEEIITTREGRMVIPVKVEFKNRVPGFIHSLSASGATVYVEPSSTLELNNEIRTLYIQEQNEIQNILKELTKQVCEVKESILLNLKILSEIDFIQAKAKYSIEVIGAEPKVKNTGNVIFKKAYHPILLQKHKINNVVPLDLEIPEDIKTIVITGPNAGGKSVAMKTVGLLTLLVQSGCHIPASPESEIKIFSNIFVDIGDDQSIENDLSSFTSHLNNLKNIIEHADSNSLILLDEIGTGTDPNEGASLAAAILEHLTSIGSTTIATTHNGLLKAFAFKSKGMQNAAMEFDQTTIQPTFHYRSGVPGSSFAIEMANRLNLPHEIIKRSREIKGQEANRLEELILDLERKSQELKTTLDKVKEEKSRLNALNIFYKNKVSTLEEEVKAIKAKALDEAKNIVSKANSIIEKSIREIKETSADKIIIKKAKDEIKHAENEFTQMLDEISTAPEIFDFQIGDIVLLKQSKTIGEIASKLDDDSYIVLSGDIRLKVPRKDLIKANSDKNLFRPVQTYQQLKIELKREIDLRGMYGDEAISAVDKFIDNAILAGIHRIDIIHGKGTGALRKKVTEYLKNNSAVKSFRLGEWNEGGAGVTVVELM